MKYFGWFVGDWTVSQAGDASTVGTLSVKLAPSQRCQFVVFLFGTTKSEGLWGYDGNTSNWIGTGFDSDGAHWKDVLEKTTTSERIKPGDSWKSHGANVAINGTKGSDTSTWTIVDENTFVVKTTRRVAGNNKLPDQEFRYARKSATGR
jgi:hypothetical protein